MNEGLAEAGQAEHNTMLPYSDEIVSADAVDVSRWEWWSHVDGGIVHFYAKGPCPACRGDTQDHLAYVNPPVEALGPRRAPCPDPSETVEMLLRCHCGSAHGHVDAYGCGRRWTLIGPAG
jgi:hypothetical protein